MSNCTTDISVLLDRALEDGDERRLRDVHVAELLHAGLAALLLLQDLHLARHVAAVELRENVLAERTDVLARDDLAPDRSLHRNLELVRRNRLREGLAHLDAAVPRLVAVHHRRERVHRLAVEEDVHLHDVRDLVARRLVVHRRIAVRDGLQGVVKVDQDLIQGEHAVQHHALRVDRLRPLHHSATVHHNAHHVADHLRGRDDARLEDRLGNRLKNGRIGHLQGIVEVLLLAALELQLVDDARARRDDVETELAAEALLHDLHVKKPEESAAETEAESQGALVVERERRVVQMQLLKPRLDLLELVRGHRIDAAEDGRMDVVEAGERLRRAELRRRHRVADLDLARILHRPHDVADLARREPLDGLLARREDADLVNRRRDARAHERHVLPGRKRTVHHAHVGDDAAELVEHRIEDKRPKRRIRPLRLRRRDALHDCLEDIGAPDARLRADEKRIVHRNREDVLDLARDLLHVRARKIDLVENRHDLELRVLREVGVGDGLRLDALRGVDDEERPFARAHRAADLVGEVDVAGRVKEVEEVGLPVLRLVVHRDGVRLDGDAALALEVHRVERLLLELACADRVGQFENAVGERRLPVVDVRNDAEVADVLERHAAWLT